MATLAEIYDWFMTGKKPTQAQFWASWGSFWNKSEQIPQSSISGLPGVLNAKAEKAQFDAHKTDENAHAALFAAKADAQALLNHIQATFEAIGLEAQTRANNDESLQFQIDDTNDFVSQARSDIAAINTLLTSNDINLDTVQEIVDAIKTFETSLSTILVNDLTTGGTTKALTAEMGKTLKGLIDGLTTNKVDKVAGERLINAAEITKLAGVTNVTTTVKTITSASLTTQDVAGFVAYINALAVVLVVGANEIVEYQLSDTGRLFKLLLRGRSFGVGQPAIVAADVEEVTLWMSKDLKLSNYPSTRNDGQLPTNRVLSTDVNGNLKMYTIATAPAPYLEILVPDSTLPSTTTNFVLKGAFFTPTMTVVIAGQTINYITFINDNEVRVNVTTSALEGYYSVTLNNGLQSVFNNALLIVLGTSFSPVESEWTNIVAPINVREYGNARIGIWDSAQSAKWTKVLDYTKNFSIRFNIQASPYGANISSGGVQQLSVKKVSDGSEVFGFRQVQEYGNTQSYLTSSVDGYLAMLGVTETTFWNNVNTYNWEFRWYNGILYGYLNNVLKVTSARVLTENLNIWVNLKRFDITNIKYIELAS